MHGSPLLKIDGEIFPSLRDQRLDRCRYSTSIYLQSKDKSLKIFGDLLLSLLIEILVIITWHGIWTLEDVAQHEVFGHSNAQTALVSLVKRKSYHSTFETRLSNWEAFISASWLRLLRNRLLPTICHCDSTGSAPAPTKAPFAVYGRQTFVFCLKPGRPGFYNQLVSRVLVHDGRVLFDWQLREQPPDRSADRVPGADGAQRHLQLARGGDQGGQAR